MVHALATRVSFDPLCNAWPVDSNPPDPVQTPSGRSCPVSGRRPSACPTVHEDVHPSTPWTRSLPGGHCPVARVRSGTQLGSCRTGGHRPDQTGKNHARGEERSPLLPLSVGLSYFPPFSLLRRALLLPLPVPHSLLCRGTESGCGICLQMVVRERPSDGVDAANLQNFERCSSTSVNSLKVSRKHCTARECGWEPERGSREKKLPPRQLGAAG
jgi:hypothetical protein